MLERLVRSVVLLLAAAISVANCDAQSQRSASLRPEYWAFTGPWDTASSRSLQQHGASLDAVVTGWITLDSATGQPVLPSPYPDTWRPQSSTPATTRRMAIVTSWHGERFHPRTVRRLARDRAGLARAAAAIARHAEAMAYAGLVLDLEALETTDRAALVRVVAEIVRAAHARGVRPVVVAVPATDTAGYPAKPLLEAADFILPMLYDQHWAGGEPGPISDPAWVRDALALRVREAGANRVVAALPTYGYRWRAGQPTDNLSFSEAQRMAKAERASLTRDAATQTLRARASKWEMWVTDATLLATLIQEAHTLGVSRIALWRLGQEDPAIWPLLKR